MADPNPPVFQWSVYCQDHPFPTPENPDAKGGWITIYSPERPTACNVDSTHRIAAVNKEALLNPPQAQVVDGSPEEDYYQSTTVVIPIPAPVTVPQVIVVEKKFSFDMSIWEMGISQDNSNRGDSFSVEISHDTPVGVLTSSAGIGATVLHVSPTVFGVVMKGCEIGVTNGVDRKEYPGTVVGIDKAAGTITMDTPLANGYGAGCPILWSVYPIRNVVCDYSQKIPFGNKGLRARFVPANTLIRFIYVDNTMNANPTAAYFQIQYYRR